MGDWQLRPLERLNTWDGRCLWYKSRKIGGREQRCSRALRRSDGDRDHLLRQVKQLVEEGILPEGDDLMELAGLMICPNNHRKAAFQQSLYNLWIERWEEDHPDQHGDSDGEVQSDDGNEEWQGQEDEDQRFTEFDEDLNTQETHDMDDFDDSGFFSEDDDGSSQLAGSGTESENKVDTETPTPTQTQDDNASSPSSQPSPPISQTPSPAIPPTLPDNNRNYRPYKLLSPKEISSSLQTKLTQSLSEREIDPGTIYGFREAAHSPYIKIGYTKDFAHRRSSLLNECGIRSEHVVFQIETRHMGKVERLIHKHLAAERRKEDVAAAAVARPCQHQTHIEWFEVGDERATEVAMAWVKFMELEPFENGGSDAGWVLGLEWKRKVVEVEGDRAEGDKWLRWLERYTSVPASGVEATIEETPVAVTETQVTVVETDMEMEEGSERVDFTPSAVTDNTPPPVQPISLEEPHATDDNSCYIPIYSSPVTTELLHLNLLTRFVFLSLQIFFFLSIVGNISFQQFTSLVFLGLVMLMARQDDRQSLSKSGKHDMGLLTGVWYPDLAGRRLC